MTGEDLKELLKTIQKSKCETQYLELKSAENGCPHRLYDTLSSFSNQDDGGIIVFGIDENNNYGESGVYDPQDLQKKVGEQCLQMEPIVRPLMTVAESDGKSFVAAEIPGMDIAERPCFYKGKGRLKGSYTRIGDSDLPMTEYEVYSYEAFRKKYQDDIRTIQRATINSLDHSRLERYTSLLKIGKPHLAALDDDTIYELMSITQNGKASLAAVMLFCPYPQAYFPQLCITAIAVPGRELGENGTAGERFEDNLRIEGTIPEMLEEALGFVRRNMRTRTIIDPETGRREDRTEYPLTAVREAVLNALVHRDYSVHTEGMPIQLIIYENRIEIKNPGGLYGRIKIDQLGKVQPDTRNPVLATALEVMGVTENRYSGIPTIRSEMKKSGLPEPEFEDMRGQFSVTFRKEAELHQKESSSISSLEEDLLMFCRIPRTRQEIAKHVGLTSVSYAIQTRVQPLIERGLIKMTLPDTPQSPRQRYYSE